MFKVCNYVIVEVPEVPHYIRIAILNCWALILKILSSMIFPSKLLEPAEQPMACPSISEVNIMEGDNFQNYGGKDQCIYIYLMWEVHTWHVVFPWFSLLMLPFMAHPFLNWRIVENIYSSEHQRSKPQGENCHNHKN